MLHWKRLRCALRLPTGSAPTAPWSPPKKAAPAASAARPSLHAAGLSFGTGKRGCCSGGVVLLCRSRITVRGSGGGGACSACVSSLRDGGSWEASVRPLKASCRISRSLAAWERRERQPREDAGRGGGAGDDGGAAGCLAVVVRWQKWKWSSWLHDEVAGARAHLECNDLGPDVTSHALHAQHTFQVHLESDNLALELYEVREHRLGVPRCGRHARPARGPLARRAPQLAQLLLKRFVSSPGVKVQIGFG